MDPRALIASDVLQCEWATAPFIFFSQNVFSPLIYYSHLVPAFAGLLLAFLIWRQKQNALLNNLFIFLALAFSIWCLIDLSLWAHDNPDYIMFAWSLLIYIEPLIYLCAGYLFYTFSSGKKAPLWLGIVSLLALAPVVLLAPTSLNLTGFSYLDCEREAFEGPLWHYLYVLEVAVIALVALYTIVRMFMKKNAVPKVQVLFLGLGIMLFLAAFSWGNIVGSFTEDWAVAQYGLFGMPIFLAAIIYLIVRFQAFRVRVLGATAMVTTLLLLLFSLLFLQTIESARPVIVVTSVLFALIGYLLIRSVRQEIEQRKQNEQLAENLQQANERLKEVDHLKSEFLSVATHQLRAPITAIRGYSANMLEGSYGPVPDYFQEPLSVMKESARLMASSIEDYLNISRIEQGSMKYEKSTFDLSALAKEVAEELLPVAANKHLTLTYEGTDGVQVVADIGKIKQVVSNFVDNAVKYTEEGGVTVTVEKVDHAVRVIVKDTGIGISSEEIGGLFEKFKRARGANKVNTTGTGLGLYVAKVLAEGNGGKVWAESDGAEKGSRFILELPA